MSPEKHLLRLAQKGATFEEVCNKLDLSPKAARSFIELCREKYPSIDYAGEHVAVRPAVPSSKLHVVPIKPVAGVYTFGVTTDLHFGSKYHLRSQFLEFLDECGRVGARDIFIPGDLLDGCYRHGRWELTKHGFQDQVEDFRTGLPQVRGRRYWGISGNHDETFERDSGMVVHTAIEEHFRAHGREDLTMLGARGATVSMQPKGQRRGLKIEMWHPLKGPAYALTYKMQKKVEGYAPGQKPDILLVGHWHQKAYFEQRGIHAFSCGTFQGGGGSFGKALGGAPSIGGWIIQVGFTTDGTLRDVAFRNRMYYENEKPRCIDARS